MTRIDTNELFANNPIEEVVGRYLTLKKNGPHLKATCPFHDDKHASLTVTPGKQLAKCFACGWSGDQIAFVMEFKGLTFKEAVTEIDTQRIDGGGEAPKQRTVTKAKPKVEWRQIIPAPPSAITHEHYLYGQPSKRWYYNTPDGQLIGAVCRFDLPDGKEVLPLTYCTDGKRKEWRWQGFERPRPLYNLHILAANPNASVLIVEGEKAADAAQAQLDTAKTVVTTWPGGSMAIEHIDWTPIHGRKVILWPDNDVQGLSAMLHVRHLVGEQLAMCRIIPLDTTLPKGWDCADKDWQEGELRKWVLSRIVDVIAPTEGEIWRMAQVDREAVYEFGIENERWVFRKVKTDTPPAEQETPPPPPPLEEEPVNNYIPPHIPDHETESDHEIHFKVLGYDKSENGQQAYYFLAKGSSQVVRLTAGSISTNTLLQIAPLTYWQDRFIGKKPFDATAALNWIINEANLKGPFKDKYLRGRGAWMDDGRVVIHAGDRLIVDGKAMNIGSLNSRYIYEVDEELGFRDVSPLPTKEAVRLMELMKAISWDREINSYLMAGWLVIAPICGALIWRPHIWLTGAAGTGKSWLFNKVVRRALGNTCLSVQGETSEAGLRQVLKHDALPVVFDEAEGADKKAHERMQSVLSLMRASSAEDGGVMAKGTAGGNAKTFRIRSCFAFASIAVQVAQQSDRSRITMLGLRKYTGPDREERWKKLQRIYNDVLTEEYVHRLQARTISLLPTILKNSETFANAAAAELGAQRAGDQLGALLAGVYSLHSNNVISYDDAAKWVQERDWSEEKALDKTADEMMLLEHLMNQMTTVETAAGKMERTVGELVAIVAGEAGGQVSVGEGDAHDRLKRLGMKVNSDKSMLVVSNTADWIRRVLKDTAWPQNHNKLLLRIEGSDRVESTRFSAGLETRGVAVPLRAIFGK